MKYEKRKNNQKRNLSFKIAKLKLSSQQDLLEEIQIIQKDTLKTSLKKQMLKNK